MWSARYSDVTPASSAGSAGVTNARHLVNIGRVSVSGASQSEYPKAGVRIRGRGDICLSDRSSVMKFRAKEPPGEMTPLTSP